MMEDILNFTLNYMNQNEKRVDRLEKAVRRNRRTAGFLTVVCFGLAIDIYRLAKDARKEKAEKADKSGE